MARVLEETVEEQAEKPTAQPPKKEPNPTRLVLLVVDRGTIQRGQGRVAMTAAARFLDSLSPRDLVGLFTLPPGGRVWILPPIAHEYASNVKTLSSDLEPSSSSRVSRPVETTSIGNINFLPGSKATSLGAKDNRIRLKLYISRPDEISSGEQAPAGPVLRRLWLLMPEPWIARNDDAG